MQLRFRTLSASCRRSNSGALACRSSERPGNPPQGGICAAYPVRAACTHARLQSIRAVPEDIPVLCDRSFLPYCDGTAGWTSIADHFAEARGRLQMGLDESPWGQSRLSAVNLRLPFPHLSRSRHSPPVDPNASFIERRRRPTVIDTGAARALIDPAACTEQGNQEGGTE